MGQQFASNRIKSRQCLVRVKIIIQKELQILSHRAAQPDYEANKSNHADGHIVNDMCLTTSLICKASWKLGTLQLNNLGQFGAGVGIAMLWGGGDSHN